MDRNSRPRGGAPYVKSTVPEAQLATKELHVDGLVVVKIVKNAHENPDCTGTLVGLDHEDHLEVTNCFPLASERSDMYVHDMLKLLREVKIDNYNLGWYMSSPLNTFYNEQFVQTMLTYQKETAGSAAIVYDPVSASLGTLYLKVCLYLCHSPCTDIPPPFTSRSSSLPALQHCFLHAICGHDYIFSA